MRQFHTVYREFTKDIVTALKDGPNLEELSWDQLWAYLKDRLEKPFQELIVDEVYSEIIPEEKGEWIQEVEDALSDRNLDALADLDIGVEENLFFAAKCPVCPDGILEDSGAAGNRPGVPWTCDRCRREWSIV
jgi:hypothetical protein